MAIAKTLFLCSHCWKVYGRQCNHNGVLQSIGRMRLVVTMVWDKCAFSGLEGYQFLAVF